MMMKTIKFSVPDMHCESCPKLISLTISDLPGIVEVVGSLKEKMVTVTYTEKANPQKIIGAIEEAGYGASVLDK